ncbi:MAG: HD-GYP domain-containing protein, partial [Acidimicrobiia bacterium]
LEPDEWEEIKRHPVLGAQIVKEIEFLEPALDSVLYHHERLNGSGYPLGLKGDMVTPWTRMLAIADTYDAMTSNRAYREGSRHQQAVDELRKCSGSLYDTEYVEAFIAAVEDANPALRSDSEPVTLPSIDLQRTIPSATSNGAADATQVITSPAR